MVINPTSALDKSRANDSSELGHWQDMDIVNQVRIPQNSSAQRVENCQDQTSATVAAGAISPTTRQESSLQPANALVRTTAQ